MTPVSIRNRSPAESAAIQRRFKAAKMRALFDDVESQLTDPVLLEMTRTMRDTVLSNPEFAEEGERPLSPAGENFLFELQAVAKRMFLPEDYEPTPDKWHAGQELLDARLVARTIHQDGRVSYRLTAAGKAWRSA